MFQQDLKKLFIFSCTNKKKNEKKKNKLGGKTQDAR